MSAIGNRRWSGSAGASLVEVMVALLIAGLVAGAAMLLAPSPERTQHDAAKRLAARMAAAGDESVLVNRRIALVITPEGYGFERLEAGAWAPVANVGVLAFQVWPAGLSPRPVETPGGALARRAVVFDPVNGANPVRIVLDGARTDWAVEIDRSGVIHVDPAT